MKNIYRVIQRNLIESSDPKHKESMLRFFKEEVNLYGVKAKDLNKLSKRVFSEVKSEDKQAIIALGESLFASGMLEEAMIASYITRQMVKGFVREDFEFIQRWVFGYITNWSTCDTFCNHTVGGFVEKFPEYIDYLKKWTGSDNKWVRRSAAVSLIVPAKKGLFFDDIIDISNMLMTDTEDMVQKGYGWLLKSLAATREDDVLEYVIKNKSILPRTSLRYAIENMPKEKKALAMAR